MADHHVVLGVDCGAESGRVIAGIFDADMQQCRLEDVHRFANGGRWDGDIFRWDWQRLTDGIETGVGKGLAAYPHCASIAVCTWGVDFGLLNADGQLVEEPVHYRDERGSRVAAALNARLSEQERFRLTGIRQMSINTLDQVFALRQERPELLDRAVHMLLAPDLLAYGLCGQMGTESSMASTTSCYAPGARQACEALLDTYELPPHLFPATQASGTARGHLLPALCERFGLTGQGPQVLATAGHDTASAVAAVPSADANVCYISSGTWSLMGTLVDEPLVSDAAYEQEFSNEVAWDGRIRLLKNIMGLWVVQECRRAFAEAGRDYDYASLTSLAEAAVPMADVLDVNDQRFLPPGTADDTMPARVCAWYAERGLAVPDGDAAIVRAVLDGLAAAYARCFADLQKLVGVRYDSIHVIGGGCKNTLLCRLTADACGVPVVAGPDEATAFGNILVQAAGLGLVQAADFAGILDRSTSLQRYEPAAV